MELDSATVRHLSRQGAGQGSRESRHGLPRYQYWGPRSKVEGEISAWYQVSYLAAVKRALPSTKMGISNVSTITSGNQAEETLQKGEAGVIVAGRAFQRSSACMGLG